MEKKCESEILIYNLLNDAKENNPDLYEPLTKIFRYLYTDLKKFFRNPSVDITINIKKEDDIKFLQNIKEYLYEEFIESEDGILKNLEQLYNNKPTYFSYFYKKIEPFLEMISSEFYSEYGIYNYVFNLYTMLKFNSLHPDDFDNFKTIVDDYAGFFITSTEDLFSKDYKNNNLNDKKNVIDALLNYNDYKNGEKIREKLLILLDEMNTEYTDTLLSEYKLAAENLLNCHEQIKILREKGINIEEETIEVVEEEQLKNINNIHSATMYTEKKSCPSQFILYAPIFLIGNNFEYFKYKLDEVEDNDDIKIDILNYIKKINTDFFEYLNKSLGLEDSFIHCMNAVFNSDTYHEVDSKLIDLVTASDIYQENESMALNLIKDIDSSKHKEVIDGIVMQWPSSSDMDKNNMIKKPQKIIDRMYELHQRIETAPSNEYYKKRRSSYYHRLTLRSFSDNVIYIIKKEKQKKQEELNKQILAPVQEPEPQKKPKGLGSLFNKKNN